MPVAMPLLTETGLEERINTLRDHAILVRGNSLTSITKSDYSEHKETVVQFLKLPFMNPPKTYYQFDPSEVVQDFRSIEQGYSKMVEKTLYMMIWRSNEVFRTRSQPNLPSIQITKELLEGYRDSIDFYYQTKEDSPLRKEFPRAEIDKAYTNLSDYAQVKIGFKKNS